jgi:rubredoxin
VTRGKEAVRIEALEERNRQLAELLKQARLPWDPIPMLLWCPDCGERHIDAGEFATKCHHTHACQKCGVVWRPAIVATVGMRFLPGFKDEPTPGCCREPTP